ncbi:MAG: hypothetical protein JXA21_07580 [Anaerolineae bacterium]|nr:hypothetical protein [Anaerolineae bacterium]
MNKKIFWLRLCYWWGIIADAVMAVLMLFPSRYLGFMNVNLAPDSGVRYGLLNGAPLMIGWTILLFWADRKPVERKDILLLTLPVIAGYIAVEVYAVFAGWETLRQTLLLFLQQIGMSAAFVVSYRNAR